MNTSTTEPPTDARRALAGRGIERLARAYSALFRISVLGQIQYRASGMIWMLGAQALLRRQRLIAFDLFA